MSEGVRCAWMRGGTSKGGYFLSEDLPADPATRDDLLMRIMGSPDPRQIDGMGGADPLTSKVAIVKRSERPGIDVDYLFLQVAVDQPLVTDSQNCGNILAGVGPFAIERGLVAATGETTEVTIFMENTSQVAVATVQTPGGKPRYDGPAMIDGVPFPSAPLPLIFRDTAGTSCGALYPTGNPTDRIGEHDVTLIDNGMPVVILTAAEFGLTGTETRVKLDANETLKSRIEAIRLEAGPMMNLGYVTDKTVPKMTLVSPPTQGGAISTRSFIPHRCHASIGVFAAVSVATACLAPGSPAARLAQLPEGRRKIMKIEHPTGALDVVLDLDDSGDVASSGLIRTARMLFDGTVFPRS